MQTLDRNKTRLSRAKIDFPRSSKDEIGAEETKNRLPECTTHSSLETLETTPYEVCQRYAVGVVDRDTTVAALIAWKYEKSQSTANDADAHVDYIQGSFDDVKLAFFERLIDTSMYEEILTGAIVPPRERHAY